MNESEAGRIEEVVHHLRNGHALDALPADYDPGTVRAATLLAGELAEARRFTNAATPSGFSAVSARLADLGGAGTSGLADQQDAPATAAEDCSDEHGTDARA